VLGHKKEWCEHTQDIELAKLRLREKAFSLVIVKKGKVVYESSSPGILSFLEAIDRRGENLRGASAADKIVGRATALLCVLSKIVEVFAVVISREAVKVLKEHKVKYQFESYVPTILNQDKTDMCPFEKLSTGIENVQEAYEKLKTFARTLSSTLRP